MGNLLAPWLAGIVYENAGYYAVFAIILTMLAFDFILRLVMIEKRNAAKWTDKVDQENIVQYGTFREAPYKPCQTRSKFPRMTLLLRSPRMLAATWGAFTYAVLISFLDATLPVFVKLTFHWNSKGAGLIFIAVSGPSLLGTLIGKASDRFGTRKVAAVGFTLIVPALAVLGTIKDDNVGSIILSCCLLILIGRLNTV